MRMDIGEDIITIIRPFRHDGDRMVMAVSRVAEPKLDWADAS